MLKMAQVYFYCSNLNDKNEKIQYLISLLKREKLYVENDRIKVVIETRISNRTLSSKQMIRKNVVVGLSNVEKETFARIEHELVINKIVEAINKILIKEDKLIFIEYYLFSYSPTKICDNHYFSLSCFYHHLHIAQENFINNMKI